MDESLRRAPGKAAPGPGRTLTRLAAFATALTAGAYLGYAPVEGRTAGPVSPAAATISAPRAAATLARVAPVQTAEAAEPSAPVRTPAKATTPSRHAPRPRAWHAPASATDGLQTRGTIAERCAPEPGQPSPRCERFTPGASPRGAAAQAAPAERIAGRVLTADGNGVAGVTVVASPERLEDAGAAGSATLRFATVTDALGAYALDGLPAGEYAVRTQTHGPYPSTATTARTGVGYADLVVTVNREVFAEGQVLAAGGEPMDGVTVLPVLRGQPSVLTDADGRFRLRVTLKPEVGSFAVRFQRPGYGEQTRRIELAAADAPLSVVMEPVEAWTSLTGKVTSDAGKPLAGHLVELRPRAARRSYRATTDSEGGYRFPVVEAADYALVVFGGADHRDHEEALRVTADLGEHDVVIDAYELGEVSGRLVNLNGEPVADFDLALRNAGSRQPNATVSTDALGNFAIPSAPAGELVLASRSDPAMLVQGLRLNPREKLHLPLVVDWGGHEIRGLIVDARGNPVPASRIVLKWSREADGITTQATRRTAADAQGHFAFTDLGPGPHSLRIDAPGFAGVELDHDLSRQGYELTVRLN